MNCVMRTKPMVVSGMIRASVTLMIGIFARVSSISFMSSKLSRM